jgi:hypothetical protein
MIGDRLRLKVNRIANRITQEVAPDTKIFVIGFNKTATLSLHQFMLDHRIRSVHWTEGGSNRTPNVALEIERRLSDHPALREYLSRWTAIMDLNYAGENEWIEGNRHFRLFDRLFPRSFFVLNDRSPDAWIKSRTAHLGGALLRSAASAHRVSEADVPKIWLSERDKHLAAVFDHFRGRKRFLHYRIDVDRPEKLTRFLRPVFFLQHERMPRIHRTVYAETSAK